MSWDDQAEEWVSDPGSEGDAKYVVQDEPITARHRQLKKDIIFQIIGSWGPPSKLGLMLETAEEIYQWVIKDD